MSSDAEAMINGLSGEVTISLMPWSGELLSPGLESGIDLHRHDRRVSALWVSSAEVEHPVDWQNYLDQLSKLHIVYLHIAVVAGKTEPRPMGHGVLRPAACAVCFVLESISKRCG